jgi:hypothetical protein
MIQHIVLLKLKTSATSEQLAAAEDGLLGMRASIPEIREVRFGPNLGPSAEQYTHILMVTCEDMKAVERYLNHPAHRQTVDRVIAPIREARLAVDFEV